MANYGTSKRTQFQSTLPLRGATQVSIMALQTLDISIHAPLAGGDLCLGLKDLVTQISIHAPLAGGDDLVAQKRRSVGISIHAPLAGGDPANALNVPKASFQSTLPLRGATRPSATCPISVKPYFNPRSPCGGRPEGGFVGFRDPYFNPRSPCGGRLEPRYGQHLDQFISIHAPLAGGD